ncbi:MAG: putative lipoic acid-binding regulatory protein [Cognaticolwellia sp.]|jgi:putative lipoic acid-binding regulatory protein
MATDTPPLSELIDFPSAFTFRAVASARLSLAEECRSLVEGTIGRKADQVQVQASSKGAFSSVRVTIEVRTAEEVIGAYGALKGLDGLKLLL